MTQKYFRVYYAYKLENHHQQFSTMADVIDEEKISDKAWEMIRKAHPGVVREEVVIGSIQEIDKYY